MSVRPDAAEEQVDSACFTDTFFVTGTFGFEVFGITVEDVHVLLLNIDMAEEVLLHERMVALRMIFGDTHIFVHVERNHVLERDLPILIKVD